MCNLILAMALLAFSTSSFPLIVGTVDMQKVLFSISEGQQIRKKLETSFNQKKTALKKQEGKLKAAKDQFDKRSQVISEKARLKEQEGLQKMLLALETKRQKYQKEIRDMETRLTGPVVKKIYAVVEEVASKAKVDLAFEVSTSPVLYARNKKDLTDKVIKRHNEKHSKQKK